MPELPEVEAVRIGLEQLVKGKEIKEVVVNWGRIIESPEVELFKTELIGEVFERFNRRGKFLILGLTHYELISHLRMEGKYEFHSSDDEVKKHTHVIFKFTDHTELRYLDVRKFGRMTLVLKDEASSYKGIQKLGPEPIESDFELATFSKQLKRSSKAIKPLLLDQKLVTGLGNIYVDEALFEAVIHPEQPADTLKPKEVVALHKAIIEVLGRAVEAGGTTIRTYKNALGEAGKFQHALNVYGQTGAPCPTCGESITKIKVAQRGTHYCTSCQKLRGSN